MSWQLAITIVCSIVGSTGIFSLVQFLITRKDKKNDKLDEITKRLDKVDDRLSKGERDDVRTQLLLMMSCYCEKIDEIQKLANYYFNVLNGDWYLTDLYKHWCEEHKISSVITKKD